MKNLRRFGIVIPVVAAVMTFVPGASATTLTSPAGTIYTGTVKAQIEEGIRVHNPLLEDECPSSSLEWKVESHGAATTAQGPITSFSVGECVEGSTVTMLKPGSLEIHTEKEKANTNGRVTWTGALMKSVVDSIFITISCTYQIQSSSEAILTGSGGQFGERTTPRFHMDVDWKLVEGSPAPYCPNEIEWTIRYQVTSPDYLDVD